MDYVIDIYPIVGFYPLQKGRGLYGFTGTRMLRPMRWVQVTLIGSFASPETLRLVVS